MNSKTDIDLNNVSGDIEPFFTKAEMDNMSDKKKYLQNSCRNYQAMLLLGLCPMKPYFMESKKYQPKKRFEETKTGYEDIEWLSSYKKKR